MRQELERHDRISRSAFCGVGVTESPLSVHSRGSTPAQIRASSALRILGIDPGSQITGFGVVDVDGHRTTAIEWGSIRTEGDHSARLREIFIALGRVVRELKPDEISIERVFLHRNADSALKLGQARAAAICATFEADVPIYEYSARQIKQAVVGRGGADKEQVQHMVQLILGLQERAAPDAADALAAAICHAHQRGVRGLLATVKI
jgi:crossover junction endodeoxyribonuclease RuvC